MPLLLLFAFVAGAGTAITPCVLPVLPALLSAGAVGGRRRYALGGRAVLERIRRGARGYLVEPVLGAVLLLTGLAMATNLDVRFEEALAKDGSLPAFLVNPTRALENSHAVQARLASLRPPPKFASTAGPASNLPRLGPAPEFTD